MKNIFVIAIIAIVIFSCNNSPKTSEQQTTPDSTQNKPYLNPAWVEDFKAFRDAVYQNNIEKLKTYFEFPVSPENNELWALINMTKEDSTLNYDAPFTEEDFIKHRKKIFTPEFITSILKIKSAELFDSLYTSTDMFTKDSTTDYNMNASVNKEDNLLHLSILYITEYEDQEDRGEFSISYQFIIRPDGRLVFKAVRMAG